MKSTPMSSFNGDKRLRRPARLGLTALAVVALLAAALPASAQKNYKDLEYPPLRDLQLPKVDRAELPNGLVLYLVEDHRLPKVEGYVLVNTGGRFEPADKVGLADITGQVMRTGGSATRKGEDIDRTLENIGASVETSIGTNSATASLWTLNENLPEVLEILADILQNPAFPQDKIELATVQERTAIARRNDNVIGIANREFVKLLYGPDSPYARHTEYETLQNITRDHLVAFHARYFHPNQTLLGLWGDFDAAEVKALVEQVFGSWPRQEVELPPLPGVPADLQASLNFIPKDDINQTNLRIGHLGGRLDDPDYYALNVMTEVLGGSFASRLFRHIRSELGLAYAVSASWSPAFDHRGGFSIFCNTKSESTVQAIEEILDEVRRITEEPVSPEELRVAKEGILNSFVFNFDTTGEIVRRLMTYEYFGYPRDFLERFKASIEKVDAQDVLQAAQKHIHPDQLVILAVGRQQDFDQPLSTLGAVNTIDIAIPQPKVAAAPAPAATPESLEQGRALLGAAIDAMGGLEALQGLKTLSSLSRVKQMTPQGELPLTSKTVLVLPDKLRQDVVLPMGEISLVFDGEKGWQKFQGGVRDLPADQVALIRQRISRSLPVLLLASQRGEREAQFLETATLDEKEADVLLLSDPEGDAVRLYVEQGTGLVLKEVFQGQSPMGAPVEEEQFFSDFRAVGGLMMPFKIVTLHDGEPYAESEVQHAEVNVEVDSALFAREQP